MPPIKILIADDEQLARKAVALALVSSGYAYHVIEAADGADAQKKICEHLPVIIFIDIQMPVLNGFEVLALLPKNYSPYIIVVSAHDTFAIKAFEHDASDYLLKPFTQQRFDQAFQKAWRQCHAEVTGMGITDFAPLAQRLQDLLGGPVVHKSRLSVKEGARLLIVPCSDIMYIEAEGEYAAIHTAKRKLLHHEPLYALEKQLDPNDFVRIHRSGIVNIKFIRELVSQYNGDYIVVMNNGHELKLSRTFREKVMQLIG